MDDIDNLVSKGVIAGGMIPKVECCADAINGGVRRTHILDGRIAHSILIEMLTDEGAGTMIQ
jgi:acetylglutamate kinase